MAEHVPGLPAAALSAACASCPAAARVAAPTVADIPAAMARLAALGWTHDRRGRACCSAACAAAGDVRAAVEVPVVRPKRETRRREPVPDLFTASARERHA